MYACVIGDKAFIEFLIGEGGDINKGNMSGNTPLISAAWKGDHGLVKFLIEHKADVNSVTLSGESVFDIFFQNNFEDEIPLTLIENGADIRINNFVNYAYEHEKENLVRAFVKKINAIDTNDASYNALLHLAIAYNDLDTVRELVKKGININAKHDQDRTPLMAAILKNNLPMAKFLIEAHANLNESNDKGETLLSLAKDNLQIMEIIEGKMEAAKKHTPKVLFDYNQERKTEIQPPQSKLVPLVQKKNKPKTH